MLAIGNIAGRSREAIELGHRLRRAACRSCPACGSGPERSGASFIQRISGPVKGPRVRPSREAICQGRSRPAMADGDYFPPPAKNRLCIAKQNRDH
jgi:hypothetical protein